MSEITIRPWLLKDKENLIQFANNPRIAGNMTDGFPYPYTSDHAIGFLGMVMSMEPLRIFAIDYKGQAIGSVGLHPLTDIFKMNMELGYWIAEPFWQQGFATEAVRLMVDYGFKEFPVQRIFARPFARNKASCRVLEKVGFTLEAELSGTIIKNNLIEDEKIYAIRKSSWHVY